MRQNTLPRIHHASGGGWAHPYGHGPFAPYLYADGGDGAGGGPAGSPPAGGDGGDPPAPPVTPGTPSAAPAAPAAGDGGEDISSLPDWAQKVIKAARDDAGKARTTAKQQAADDARKQLAADIDKALGRTGADKPADPAELTKTIGEQTGRIGDLEGSVRSLSVELAAYKAAGKHDANPAALLDSRSFLKSVEGLDPSEKDFASKLDTAIKAAVESNSQLRTGQAPRRGGGEFQGGPGAREGRPASLGQAISAKLGG